MYSILTYVVQDEMHVWYACVDQHGHEQGEQGVGPEIFVATRHYTRITDLGKKGRRGYIGGRKMGEVNRWMRDEWLLCKGQLATT